MKLFFRSLLVLSFLMSVSCSNDEQIETENQSNQIENDVTEKKTKELLNLLEEIEKTKKITQEQKELYENLISDDKITISIRSNSELAKIMSENKLDFSLMEEIDTNKTYLRNDCDRGNLNLSSRFIEPGYGSFTLRGQVNWGFSSSVNYRIVNPRDVVSSSVSNTLISVLVGDITIYTTPANVTMESISGNLRDFQYYFRARINKCNGSGFIAVEDF
ncbi:hypothetical protein [Aquimarina sp. RZ0]|uniref:hypothetical protein n=1 Tax=Aquimarina sp. RZ0 TaxID=2607730 RepID=UPI0011F233BE|nr:hypothetical protein [Aquimarina sp. RZ0]KAA1243092.1 hypothetical protein F0000_22590 [Aquimarina sp. RZ0]